MTKRRAEIFLLLRENEMGVHVNAAASTERLARIMQRSRMDADRKAGERYVYSIKPVNLYFDAMVE